MRKIELARPFVLDALLARRNITENPAAHPQLLASDLAPARRNLRELEHLCAVAWIKASLTVLGTTVCAHGELLVHKVLLLLLTVPIPEFDLLAWRTEPSELIPTACQGRHSTDLLISGAVEAYCCQLITGGCRVDIRIVEETDPGAVVFHFDRIPRGLHGLQIRRVGRVGLFLSGRVGLIAGGAARIGEIRLELRLWLGG